MIQSGLKVGLHQIFWAENNTKSELLSSLLLLRRVPLHSSVCYKRYLQPHGLVLAQIFSFDRHPAIHRYLGQNLSQMLASISAVVRHEFAIAARLAARSHCIPSPLPALTGASGHNTISHRLALQLHDQAPACSCSCAHLVFGLFKLKKLFEYIDLISEVVLLFRTELRLV